MEYQQVAAACFFFLPSTDGVFGLLSWNGAGVGVGGLVFGTLLGPEATGPGFFPLGRVPGLFVSGFLAASIAWLLVLWGGCVWGVWFGVVV